MINHTDLWEVELAWYSHSATYWICLYSLKHGIGISDFRSTSHYSTVINRAFTFYTANVFMSWPVWTLKTKVPKLDSVVSSSVQLSNHSWSNAQHVSTPTTMILSSTAVTFHSLNCFGHMIYAPQTRMYQNIAKLLTHPNNSKVKCNVLYTANQNSFCFIPQATCLDKDLENKIACLRLW